MSSVNSMDRMSVTSSHEQPKPPASAASAASAQQPVTQPSPQQHVPAATPAKPAVQQPTPSKMATPAKTPATEAKPPNKSSSPTKLSADVELGDPSLKLRAWQKVVSTFWPGSVSYLPSKMKACITQGVEEFLHREYGDAYKTRCLVNHHGKPAFGIPESMSDKFMIFLDKWIDTNNSQSEADSKKRKSTTGSGLPDTPSSKRARQENATSPSRLTSQPSEKENMQPAASASKRGVSAESLKELLATLDATKEWDLVKFGVFIKCIVPRYPQMNDEDKRGIKKRVRKFLTDTMTHDLFIAKCTGPLSNSKTFGVPKVLLDGLVPALPHLLKMDFKDETIVEHPDFDVLLADE